MIANYPPRAKHQGEKLLAHSKQQKKKLVIGEVVILLLQLGCEGHYQL